MPAWRTSGSRPGGFFAAAIAVSTEIPSALALVLSARDLPGGEDLRIRRRMRAAGRVVGEVYAADDEKLVRVVGELAGGPRRLVREHLVLGQRPGRRRPEPLRLAAAAQRCARLDHAIVAHDDDDERRARRGLRRCFARHETLEQRQTQHQPAGALEDQPSIHEERAPVAIFHGVAPIREGDSRTHRSSRWRAPDREWRPSRRVTAGRSSRPSPARSAASGRPCR